MVVVVMEHDHLPVIRELHGELISSGIANTGRGIHPGLVRHIGGHHQPFERDAVIGVQGIDLDAGWPGPRPRRSADTRQLH